MARHTDQPISIKLRIFANRRGRGVVNLAVGSRRATNERHRKESKTVAALGTKKRSSALPTARALLRDHLPAALLVPSLSVDCRMRNTVHVAWSRTCFAVEPKAGGATCWYDCATEIANALLRDLAISARLEVPQERP